ncbi:hypothetical protein R1sor_020806 [Riccia sorocarpa]|uniref:Uncharacterized protein n=1 Tax=Riccia sorocarpa TaxID=122646 RepID=A0ABD3GF85_9MARC
MTQGFHRGRRQHANTVSTSLHEEVQSQVVPTNVRYAQDMDRLADLQDATEGRQPKEREWPTAERDEGANIVTDLTPADGVLPHPSTLPSAIGQEPIRAMASFHSTWAPQCFNGQYSKTSHGWETRTDIAELT